MGLYFSPRRQIQAAPASSSSEKDFKSNVIFQEIKENLDKVCTTILNP